MTTLWMDLLILATFGSLCGFLTWQLTGRLRSVIGGIAVEVAAYAAAGPEASNGGSTRHHVHGIATVDISHVKFEEDALPMAQGQASPLHISAGHGRAGHRSARPRRS